MKKALTLCLASAAMAALIGAPQMAAAQAQTPTLATTLAPAENGGTLTVTSSAFENDGAIPDTYSQYGANQTPPLAWTAGPEGTKSYVLLVEDAGVARPSPIFHWVLYNIPADVTSLPADMSKDADPGTPKGAINGLNNARRSGYMGPRPPKGSHPYHFEVFALDTTLSLKAEEATRDAVVTAMKGHVLAEGALVGNYAHNE
jgi:Raf kinase inhibitor-like YbhB/YbcL family protein